MKQAIKKLLRALTVDKFSMFETLSLMIVAAGSQMFNAWFAVSCIILVIFINRVVLDIASDE